MGNKMRQPLLRMRADTGCTTCQDMLHSTSGLHSGGAANASTLDCPTSHGGPINMESRRGPIVEPARRKIEPAHQIKFYAQLLFLLLASTFFASALKASIGIRQQTPAVVLQTEEKSGNSDFVLKHEARANIRTTASTSADACKGRRIHVLNLDPRFNTHLMTKSQEWTWGNSGFGRPEDSSVQFHASILQALNASYAQVQKHHHHHLEAVTTTGSEFGNEEGASGSTISTEGDDSGRMTNSMGNSIGGNDIGGNLIGGNPIGGNSFRGSFIGVNGIGENAKWGYESTWPLTPNGDAWFSTSQFALEIIFHARMKLYPCLTEQPRKADAIYVPYYLGLDVVQYTQGNKSLPLEMRNSTAIALAVWLIQQRAWRRHQGEDHFFVSGRVGWDYKSEWGVGLMSFPSMTNSVAVSVEAIGPLKNDVSVPYPTIFHPPTSKELTDWLNFVKGHSREALFSLVGARRSWTKLREVLFWQCEESASCWLVDCDNPNTKCQMNWAFAMHVYLNSLFCLQPRGDTCTRRGLIDSLLSGCIPVVFEKCALSRQYHWHLPGGIPQHTTDGAALGLYYVYIPAKSLKMPTNLEGKQVETPEESQSGTNFTQEALVERVLRAIPAKKIWEIQERILGLIPRITFGGRAVGKGEIAAPDFDDAFDVTVKAMTDKARRRKKARRDRRARLKQSSGAQK